MAGDSTIQRYLPGFLVPKKLTSVPACDPDKSIEMIHQIFHSGYFGAEMQIIYKKIKTTAYALWSVEMFSTNKFKEVLKFLVHIFKKGVKYMCVRM